MVTTYELEVRAAIANAASTFIKTDFGDIDYVFKAVTELVVSLHNATQGCSADFVANQMERSGLASMVKSSLEKAT